MLPYFTNRTLSKGSIILKEENELKMPIGSMILPILHGVCSRRNNGQPMIAKASSLSFMWEELFGELNFWRRHFMVFMFDGVAWVSLKTISFQPYISSSPLCIMRRERLIGWMCPLGEETSFIFAAHAPRGVWKMIWSPCAAMCFSMRWTI